MTQEVLIKDGTAKVWADSTDYSSTVSGLTRTHQIDLTSLASGSYREGAKADLGATRARRFLVLAAFEIAASAASDEIIKIFWAGSPSGTAANANPGGTSGSDGAYSGTAGDSADDSAKQLIHVGNFITTSDNTTVVQYQVVGVLEDIPRYGMPVVKNGSTGALHSDAVEMYIALIPIVDEIQNAV